MYHKMSFKRQVLIQGYPFHWAKCYSRNNSCYIEKRKIHVIGFISNQTITVTLVGKSAFELVH